MDSRPREVETWSGKLKGVVRLLVPSESPDSSGKPLSLRAAVDLPGGWWLQSVTYVGAEAPAR